VPARRIDGPTAEKLDRRRKRRSNNNAFINVPYDRRYENQYLALIAGLCGFGLIPRATIEIPGGQRRLDRIFALIRQCRYSFHDLSRVQLDRAHPPTPRFNMPFELGLAVASAKMQRARENWYVFEAVRRRLSKSLSDLDGSDPYIHNATPERLLRELTNALVRRRLEPTVRQLEDVYSDLRKAVPAIKRELRTDTLFAARPFRDLITVATRSVQVRIVGRRP